MSKSLRIHKLLRRVTAPPVFLAISSSSGASWFLSVPSLSCVWTRLRTNDSAAGGKGFPHCYSPCKLAVPTYFFQICIFEPPALPLTAGIIRWGDFPELCSNYAHLWHITSQLSSFSEDQSLAFARHRIKDTLSACHFNYSSIGSFPGLLCHRKCQRTE